jgi:hypothetical protein
MDKVLLNEIEQLEKEKDSLDHSTNIAKLAFIREIKSGLGEEIKKHPNALTQPKISRWVKFKKFLISIFVKF